MENRINTYTCPKNHVMVTQDIAEGVTPMFINCRQCGQNARSAGYQADQSLIPLYEWYKPAHPERYTTPGMQHHIEQGGLAFRCIGDPDETESMKPIEPVRSQMNFSGLAMRALTNLNKTRR